MVVGTLLLQLRLNGVQSLKEKRGILQSIIVRTRNKFNVSIAEVAKQDLWQISELGIAVVSNSSKHVDQQLQKIIQFFEQETILEIISIDTEIL